MLRIYTWDDVIGKLNKAIAKADYAFLKSVKSGQEPEAIAYLRGQVEALEAVRHDILNYEDVNQIAQDIE